MNIDKSNMIKTLRSIPDMTEKAIKLGDDITFPKQFVNNIAVVGMGGSGFTGDLLSVYLHDVAIPVHVVKDYKLPKYLSKKTLVVVISYSGNTEETISAYRSAVRRGYRIVAISSNGKLKELCKMNKTPFIEIPSGIQPRISVPYLFLPLLNVLSYSGIIDDQEKSIKNTIKHLKNVAKEIEENGKVLSRKVKGKIPIIYSSQKMMAIAEKWKTDINENAKTHAFYNVFPEFNHNEICGYENPNGNFYVIIISDTDDNTKIKDRIKVFKKVMRKYDVEITQIEITGKDFLTRLLSTIWMGQFLAYYLALEYEVDPTPVKIIEDFKKQL